MDLDQSWQFVFVLFLFWVMYARVSEPLSQLKQGRNTNKEATVKLIQHSRVANKIDGPPNRVTKPKKEGIKCRIYAITDHRHSLICIKITLQSTKRSHVSTKNMFSNIRPDLLIIYYFTIVS